MYDAPSIGTQGLVIFLFGFFFFFFVLPLDLQSLKFHDQGSDLGPW